MSLGAAMNADRGDPEVRIAHLEGLLNAAALERHALLDRRARYRAALVRIADSESGHWGWIAHEALRADHEEPTP